MDGSSCLTYKGMLRFQRDDARVMGKLLKGVKLLEVLAIFREKKRWGWSLVWG